MGWFYLGIRRLRSSLTYPPPPRTPSSGHRYQVLPFIAIYLSFCFSHLSILICNLDIAFPFCLFYILLVGSISLPHRLLGG